MKGIVCYPPSHHSPLSYLSHSSFVGRACTWPFALVSLQLSYVLREFTLLFPGLFARLSTCQFVFPALLLMHSFNYAFVCPFARLPTCPLVRTTTRLLVNESEPSRLPAHWHLPSGDSACPLARCSAHLLVHALTSSFTHLSTHARSSIDLLARSPTRSLAYLCVRVCMSPFSCLYICRPAHLLTRSPACSSVCLLASFLVHSLTRRPVCPLASRPVCSLPDLLADFPTCLPIRRACLPAHPRPPIHSSTC